MRDWLLRLVVATATVCAILLSFEGSAHAFPWLIRDGYNTCNTCHADPSGAGILTQYGRGMEEVILRMQYKKTDDPGTIGNFLFGGVKLPDQLLLQTDYRSLVYAQQAGGGKFGNPQFIIMQADQSAQLKVGRFRMNGSIGYSPPPPYGGALGATLTDAPADWGAVVARQYWLGLDLGKDEEFLLRLGRINVPYGIRTVEHTLWTRIATRSDINVDQQHGLALAYTGAHLRGEVMALLGNYAIHPDAFRERGGSAYFEWLPTEKLGVGASAKITHADDSRTDLTQELNPAVRPGPNFRQNYGIFGRYSPAKAFVLLTEGDLLYNSQQATATGPATNNFGAVGYLQADLQPIQGLHVMATGELYNPAMSQQSTSAGVWGSLWWFFAPHCDMRADVIYQSSVSPTNSRSDVLSLLLQFHGYL